VFHDLDSTLVQLLNDAPAAELPELRAAEVSFEPPDRNFAPGQATVDLFLHEVRENRELRDSRPVIDKTGPTYVTRRAPIRLDCSYVVTTWAAGTIGAARIVSEHRLLGQALAWLSRFPTIPARYLQGSLGGPTYPPPALVAHHDPDRHAAEFWVALGISPRPAFSLSVTLEVSLGSGAVGDLVTTRTTEFSANEAADRGWVQMGGLVLDLASGAGIADVVVDLVDLDLRTRSDNDGQFSFPRVPVGSHTVRAVATSFQTVTQHVVVPGQLADFTLKLTRN